MIAFSRSLRFVAHVREVMTMYRGQCFSPASSIIVVFVSSSCSLHLYIAPRSYMPNQGILWRANHHRYRLLGKVRNDLLRWNNGFSDLRARRRVLTCMKISSSPHALLTYARLSPRTLPVNRVPRFESPPWNLRKMPEALIKLIHYRRRPSLVSFLIGRRTP